MRENPEEAPLGNAFRELIRVRVGDAHRLEAVAATGLLDTEPEEPFDRLAQLATTVLGTTWGFVTIVDDVRSYWKACVGVGDLAVDQRQNELEHSFCQYVVATGEPFLIDDARIDPRTADNPSITSMGVVAWAGAPIRGTDGTVLGTVCVVADEARYWTSGDAAILQALADIAADEIRLRSSLEEVDRAAASLAELAVHSARSQAILGTAVDRAPIGFGLLDGSLRYLAVNDALAAINGLPAKDHLGRRIDEVVPSWSSAAEALLAQVLDTGVPVLDVEHTGETAAQPGVTRYWTSSYYRIETPNEVVGVAALVTETTTQRLQERRLRQVMDSLFTFVTLLSPDGSIVEINRSALDAAGQELEDLRGLSFWDAYWWSHDPQGRSTLRQAVARAAVGETVRYDTEIRVLGDRRITIDLQLVPLVEGGRVTAVVASALDISERLAVRRRTERIAHLARRLTCSASTAEAVEVIHQEGAAVLGATVAEVALVDHLRGLLQVLPAGAPAPGWGRPMERAMADGGPLATAVHRRQVTVTPLDAEQGTAERGAAWAAPRVTTASAPLMRADGTIFGAISFQWNRVIPDAALTRSTVETVADLCAQTLDRTLHADVSHDLVGTLQQELLATTPEIPDLEVAVRYQPADRELGFGGDWYEVVPLDQQRTAVIVGDVAGHGVPAAARMAQVRTVLSTLVQLGDDLEGLFDRAERLIERSLRPLFATVSVSIVDTANAELVALSAGHPPPLVIQPSGRVTVVRPSHRPLLGVPGRRLDLQPVPFPDGSVLVSYTDGLVERRGESIDIGIERLRQHLEPLEGEPAEDVADALLGGLVGPNHGDDAALAVVRHRRGRRPVEPSSPVSPRPVDPAPRSGP